MSKSVEPLLNAIKSAGEAALRLHEENKTLRAELERLKEAERLLGAASLCVNDSLIGRGWHRQYAAYKLAAAKSPETAKLLSPKEYCLLLCAWKGGSPCLAEDCPRKPVVITDEWLDQNPDYTCVCGIYVHPSKRNPAAIHIPDCQFATVRP